MRARWRPTAIAVVLLTVLSGASCASAPASVSHGDVVRLPSPGPLSTMTLDDALASRRSVREIASDALAPQIVGQLLWAAQGVTSPDGGRTAPSAGALYPLDVYVVMATGVFQYRPASHELMLMSDRDLRGPLRAAALDQAVVGEAAVVVVIAADRSRTTAKYGAERGERYVVLEAGHAAQNVLLEATALGLGAVPIGAFDDAAVARVVGLGPSLVPLYLIPVGARR